MHDLSLARGILDLALKEAKGRKVLRIKIDLAEDGHLTKETLKEAFNLISEGTLAQEAVLEIRPLENIVSAEGDLPETKVTELEIEED